MCCIDVHEILFCCFNKRFQIDVDQLLSENLSVAKDVSRSLYVFFAVTFFSLDYFLCGRD